MNKDEVEKLCSDSYRRGYREGFEDACKRIESFSKSLSDVVENILEQSVGIYQGENNETTK